MADPEKGPGGSGGGGGGESRVSLILSKKRNRPRKRKSRQGEQKKSAALHPLSSRSGSATEDYPSATSGRIFLEVVMVCNNIPP